MAEKGELCSNNILLINVVYAIMPISNKAISTSKAQ
jgi:hypothetical protein